MSNLNKKTWTNEPHLLIPPIEKAEILSSSNDRVIQRKLIPKRKSKDAPLVETIEYHNDHNNGKSVETNKKAYFF